MTTTRTERTRTRIDVDTRRSMSEMQELARRVERHHTEPLPEAEIPARRSFPTAVVVILWLGIVGGGVLGAFVGTLLRSNTLVIPNIEGLYSMTPFTFEFFWMTMGVVLGIVVAAVATLFISPHDDTPQHIDLETTAENVIEVDLDEGEE